MSEMMLKFRNDVEVQVPKVKKKRAKKKIDGFRR